MDADAAAAVAVYSEAAAAALELEAATALESITIRSSDIVARERWTSDDADDAIPAATTAGGDMFVRDDDWR